MELALTRTAVADPGTWLRAPSQVFSLTALVRFSQEERWLIENYNLFDHLIFDRTPPWYFRSLREAERNQERAEQTGERFDWPWYVPSAAPPEWKLTVAQLLGNPRYTVTFGSAYELAQFEPRMMAAFAEFKQFLRSYGSRPQTVHWRF